MLSVILKKFLVSCTREMIYLYDRLRNIQLPIWGTENTHLSLDTGYPHDGRADKDSYPHDRHNQCIMLSL